MALHGTNMDKYKNMLVYHFNHKIMNDAMKKRKCMISSAKMNIWA